LIPILEARGFHVTAVQNPLTSLADDANATRRIIALQNGPVILVGHSWGGAVITEVGDDPKVAGFVYVAAYAQDIGKSANDTSAPFGLTPGQKSIRVDSQHFASMSEEGILNHFAQGLPMSERRACGQSDQSLTLPVPHSRLPAGNDHDREVRHRGGSQAGPGRPAGVRLHLGDRLGGRRVGCRIDKWLWMVEAHLHQ
jgi:pimeloyl-ACP methyl ester carboxylesterase